ncbi:putative outer membrane lipoprotein [Leucobacter exalbidus]|uniref:Outer membrane lipoprotein n=1 Tax=Leucobacter exalbidus TaxID=662960 RepID=A0A940PSK9_9MICO|nr:hypothetical protein [Leucobacter exalbidus]MBP1325475.1 putative outer membrane lipoprotein [Leucobacter exalbidus]
MSALALTRSEATKFFSATTMWVLALVTMLATWPMAWTNVASGADLPADDPRLFSAEPIPISYQGFEMAGFGYVLVVVLAALWAGSEYGAGKQIRTTLLATPQRLRVFIVKTVLLACAVAVIGFLTMWGTIVITHAAGNAGIDPWALTPAIWANIGGVTLAWILTALIAFAVGVLARTAILPLILVIPLVIGIGDFLAGFWEGAKYLPVAAGAALYSDTSTGIHLGSVAGGLVQATWALALLTVAAVSFVRRDM